MKSLFLRSMCILLCLVVLSNCTKSEKYYLPNLKIDSPYNFEKISVNDSIEFNVGLFNLGDEKLKIDNINVQCGCLADFKYDFIYLQPSEKRSIVFNYKPSKIGYVEENVFIYFVGYKNPIHLLIKGRVVE